MDFAKKGKLTSQIKEISKKEGVSEKFLIKNIAKGKITIPKNKIREDLNLFGIGKNLSIKVNANIGTSKDHIDFNEEIKKAKVATEYGADAIMDLSTGGDIQKLRKKLVEEINVPIGTVPIYEAALNAQKKSGAIVEMTEDDIFGAISNHIKDGIDFLTVHCGITKSSVETLKDQNRLAGIVSRGGAFHSAHILHNNCENPLYKNFDYLLDLVYEHDVTLSLGDGLRPGSIYDSTDRAQIQELITLGELVKRARKKNVQTMVEGPGHIPINEIKINIQLQKKICNDAPFYVLGPLVTDIACGYDHITSAIGGAIAATYGADFLCYVTPSEHLGLPDERDVREGVIASKIAAHSADIACGRNINWDHDISRARRDLNWDAVIEGSIDPKRARKIRKRSKLSQEEVCSMCGDLCAIKTVRDYINLDKKEK